MELLADLGELAGVDGDQRGVLGLWDRKMLDIQGDQVEGKFCRSLSFWVLEGDLQSAWVLLAL